MEDRVDKLVMEYNGREGLLLEKSEHFVVCRERDKARNSKFELIFEM